MSWRVSTLFAVLLTITLGMTACGDDGDGGDGSRASGSADGETIYNQNCASCHGGEGEGGVGPEVGGGVLVEKYSVDEQREIVAEGRNNMPGFGSSLSDDEIDAVVVYERDVLGG